MVQPATATIPQRERREDGTRYQFSFPVKAVWQSQINSQTNTQNNAWASDGKTIWENEVMSLGHTENVGPAGALIHFKELPPVGAHVSIEVTEASEGTVRVEAEVIRVIHNPDQPLAALAVTANVHGWQTLVWEVARRRTIAEMEKPPEDEDNFFKW
ncbi:MAG: hypothetical protein H0T92_15660 [Pyrinomonadaceae bacterium]|nr:hypothetical protein [Pyrinomonadaceae bacterium]